MRRLENTEATMRARVVVCLALCLLASVAASSARAAVPPQDQDYIRSPPGDPVGTLLVVQGGGWRVPTEQMHEALLRQRGYYADEFGWEMHSVGFRDGALSIRDVIRWYDRLRAETTGPICVFGRSSGGQ